MFGKLPFGKIAFGKRKTAPAPTGEVSEVPPKWPPTEAELRAHVARRMPVIAAPRPNFPPPWREQWRMITEARRDAVLMLPIVPSDRSESPTSFIGGLPYVSGDFAWPRGTPYRNANPKKYERPQPVRAPESRSFIGQIDCLQIPEFEGRHLLPQQGRLCFFFDWMVMENHAPYDHPHADAVVWDNGEGPLAEAAVPADLPPCQGDASGHYYGWISKAEPQRFPRKFCKWALELRTIQTYPDESYLDPTGASQLVYRAIVNRLMREQFRLIVRDPPAARRFTATPGLPRPSATFPECWIHVDIATGKLIETLRVEIDSQHTPPELRQEYRATIEEAAQAANEARSRSPFDVLTQFERDAFFAWYVSLVAPRRDGVRDQRTLTYMRGHIETAYRAAAEMLAAEGGELSRLLDEEALNAVRLRHLPYHIRQDGRSEASGWHQMFGHGANVQIAAERFRGSHVLLAQFASAGPFMWGDAGVLQYWIDAGDLAARDFSRVLTTVESH
jgi:hypothetical protein